MVPIDSLSDSFLLVYIHKFIQNSGVHITIWGTNETIKTSLELKEAIRSLDHAAPNHLSIHHETKDNPLNVASYDLIISSLSTWRNLLQSHAGWLKDIPSVLILKA